MNTTWKLAARLAWSRPWMFSISFVMWVLFMGSPLATGLITRAFFNTLTGEGIPTNGACCAPRRAHKSGRDGPRAFPPNKWG